MNKEYKQILYTLLEKYREIFISLYSINDDELDLYLLNYLWYYSYVVLMKNENTNENEILLGQSHEHNGFDKHGFVKSGIARYKEQLFSTERKTFNENNSVTIYSSLSKESVMNKVYEFITEIASIYYAEQNNLRLSMVKAIIKGTKKQAQVMEEIFNQTFMNSKSVIVIKDNADDLPMDLSKIDLDIKYIAKEYQESIIFYHNQILEKLGVNYTPFEKKERMIVDEVNSNNHQQNAIKETFRKMIQYKLNKFNRLFNDNLNITINGQEREEKDENLNNEDSD